MCLAVPAEIVELQGNDMARARIGASQTYMNISVMLVPEKVHVGDFVLIHAGFALHKLNEEEAAETLRILRELAEAETGCKANF